MAITVSSHVIDIRCGRPAPGIRLRLAQAGSSGIGEWVDTDETGRVARLHGPDLPPGDYVLDVDCRTGQDSPTEGVVTGVSVHLALGADGRHYHLPVLLSPSLITCYLGSAE